MTEVCPQETVWRFKALEYARNYRGVRLASPRQRAKALFSICRARAKKASLPFDLTADWVEAKITSGRCEVTGIPFVLVGEIKKRNPWAPSIDRINPTAGYTKDNVQVTCWIYNCAKGQASHEDVVRMAKALSG